MSRSYRCTECDEVRQTLTTRGRLPRVCPDCRGPGHNGGYVLKDVAESDDGEVAVRKLQVPPVPPPIQRTPFNSTPVTAPALAPAQGAGRIETKLMMDLSSMGLDPESTLAEVAVTVARAADTLGPADIRPLIAASKEIRAILAQLVKAGGETSHAPADTERSNSPFGAVRPELVNPPTA